VSGESAQPEEMAVFDAAKARLLEVRYATPVMVERRRAVIEALTVRPGERALDVGTGPGFLAVDLAEAVGSAGEVAAIDQSAEMVAFAADRVGRLGLADRIAIRQADAVALPYPEAGFDVVTATQVFEYVAEVERAIAEARRVLRPGGRLALIDADWSTWVWHVDDADLMDRIDRVWSRHAAHHHLPRYLAPLLRSGGFAVEAIRILPILCLDGGPGTFSATLAESIAGYVRSRPDPGAAADAAAWLADLGRQVERGGYFFSANQYLFVARKT
jgi:arsenite methyltransferase